MAAAMEEPMLYRLNRLDNILKQLEDIRVVNYSPKSSYVSTTSSGTLTSTDADFSPRSLEKHCRPINEVMMEVEKKGNLVERLVHAEDRLLKLCLQLEEEIESERNRELTASAEKKSHSPRKALQHFVKSWVGGKTKHKNND